MSESLSKRESSQESFKMRDGAGHIEGEAGGFIANVLATQTWRPSLNTQNPDKLSTMVFIHELSAWEAETV